MDMVRYRCRSTAIEPDREPYWEQCFATRRGVSPATLERRPRGGCAQTASPIRHRVDSPDRNPADAQTVAIRLHQSI